MHVRQKPEGFVGDGFSDSEHMFSKLFWTSTQPHRAACHQLERHDGLLAVQPGRLWLEGGGGGGGGASAGVCGQYLLPKLSVGLCLVSPAVETCSSVFSLRLKSSSGI